MAIKFGTSALKNLMFGSSQVQKVYYGATLVWQRVKWSKHFVSSTRALVSTFIASGNNTYASAHISFGHRPSVDTAFYGEYDYPKGNYTANKWICYYHHIEGVNLRWYDYRGRLHEIKSGWKLNTRTEYKIDVFMPREHNGTVGFKITDVHKNSNVYKSFKNTRVDDYKGSLFTIGGYVGDSHYYMKGGEFNMSGLYVKADAVVKINTDAGVMGGLH